jgi:multisubunit Na+/H+ antiporter MnhB subunit
MILAFDIGLAVLLLLVAAWAVLVWDTFAAVVGFVVYGLLLGLVWVRLSAVDVALTEAAVGGGVTGMLLLGAAARLRNERTTWVMPALPVRLAAGVLSAIVSVGLAAVVLFPSSPAPTLAPPAVAGLVETGLGNAVAGVLFVFRSLDTLLEKVVLLLALVGVWSLAPDRAWRGVPGLHILERPNGILTLLAQFLPPIGIVVAIYMAWVGANEPGGAFQGGTVLAAMWLLVMIAGLQPVPAINRLWLRVLLIVGPVVFLAIGLAGFVLADAFLAYPAGYAKPLIVAVEATLTLSIGITLGLLAAGPPERMRLQ